MIYLYESNNNDASIVFDETSLNAEQKAQGIAVSELPTKEKQSDKIAILKCRKSTDEVWYEYVDVLPTEEDKNTLKIQSLEEENSELLFKSSISEMKIEGLENDVSELMLKVVNLELGGLV